MPYFQFEIDAGADDSEVIKADTLRTAWKEVVDRFTEDKLMEVTIMFMTEVEMPPGFEDEVPTGGNEEGTPA